MLHQKLSGPEKMISSQAIPRFFVSTRCGNLATAVTLILCGLMSALCDADDYVLTIGGGYSPKGNQVSLEKNVLLFQRVLKAIPSEIVRNDVYFADGNDDGKDLIVHDRDRLPEANRLMAEIFGKTESLGLSFRNHQVPNVNGPSEPKTVRKWFRDIGSQMHAGDRLLLYVTAHGGRSRDSKRDHETSIAMWNQSSLKMSELAQLLDGMDSDVDVVMVMVQCYTGGFSHLIYQGGDPANGLADQNRVGFFATVHDRPAAGCTPDVNEANYKEYSTYFLAAYLGTDRMGKKIERPDYDGDGRISLEEAHAYTILNADTIDLPVKTSGEFLREESRFGKGDEDLLRNDEEYDVVLKYASPIQLVLLRKLSDKLDLTGKYRIDDAWRRSRSDRRRRSPTRRSSNGARSRIASDLLAKWPELKNPFNPLVTELLTSRQEEFLNEVRSHPQFEKYQNEVSSQGSEANSQTAKVHYERFLRVVDNVLLGENLRRLKQPAKLLQYESLIAAERQELLSPRANSRSTGTN